MTIPERTDQLDNRKRLGSAGGRPYAYDPKIYKHRNVVERCFTPFQTMARDRHPIRQESRQLPRRDRPGSVILWLKTWSGRHGPVCPI